MEFTSEQQTFIDGLISRKYSEAFQKAQQVLTETAEAKYKTMLTEAHDKLRIMAIESAAAEHGAVDASQVAALMDGSIKVDDSGSLFVVDGEGERRYNRDGAPLTVKDAVADFLVNNPHLAGRRASTGAGTSNQDFLGLD